MSANHGNTPAAWISVAVALAGFLVGTVGVMMNPVNLTILWIGIILCPVALVIFLVLNRTGLGDAH